jgi:ATP-binding cassette subfamily B protein
VKLLFRYLRHYRGLILIALLLAAVNQIFSFIDPYLLGRVIDKYVKHYQDYEGRATEFLYGVLTFIGLAMGASMVSRIAKNFQDYFLSTVIQRLGARIYQDGLKHSLQMPYSVFEDQRSGETLGVLQKVRTDSERLITSFVNVIFTSIVGIIFVIVFSFNIYWPIAPLYLATVPALGFMSAWLGRKIKKVQKRIVSETTALAGSTTESLRNIELVKSLGLTEQEVGRLNRTTDKILTLELQKVKYVRSISFVQGTFVNLMRNTIIFMIIYLIFREKVSEGQFITLYMYSFYIFGPLQELGNVINTYRESEVSLQNFERILNTPKEETPSNPVAVPSIDRLRFEGVWFKHASASEYAVQEIAFEAGKGETIAFVGPSGSGKTTLVKLLVGLYLPEQGAILYNDVERRTLDINAFRKQIGFVTQDTQLFAGTIRENLLFVAPGSTDAECEEALRQAACTTLMARAEKGLDTVIGEGGVKLSGGEKQRLSIARALLRKPSLLILDEATSALDSITEEAITDTIKSIHQHRELMTILIAHRLSTVMHADRIYVLEHGSVVECGTHEALLDQKGLYYAMWRQQVGERKPKAQITTVGI